MDFNCEPSTSTAGFVSKHSKRKATKKSTSKRCSKTTQTGLTLDVLPEDVLLELFSYLNSSDLSNLSACSWRIGQICNDRRMWRKIHDRCNGFSPHLHDPLLSIFSNSNTSIKVSCTRKLTLEDRRCKTSSLCLRRDFFKKLVNSPNLETFILENHSFDVTTFWLNYFPASLTELRLNGSHVFRLSSKWKTVFSDMHKQLPNLEILDLSRCYWIKSAALKGIFKCAKIKTLILFGCRKLNFSVAIEQMSFFPIFSSLETFDARKLRWKLADMTLWPVAGKLRHLFLDPFPDTIYWWESQPHKSGIEKLCNCLKNIETLVVRHDRVTLTHSMLMNLAACCKSLQYLDIHSSVCTAATASSFRNVRPDVELSYESIEYDFDSSDSS